MITTIVKLREGGKLRIVHQHDNVYIALQATLAKVGIANIASCRVIMTDSPPTKLQLMGGLLFTGQELASRCNLRLPREVAEILKS